MYSTNPLTGQLNAHTDEEMKFLDECAMRAMQAEMARDEGYSFNTDKSMEEGCRFAYKVAKEMLKQRKEVLK